jgi:hypothetical protein
MGARAAKFAVCSEIFNISAPFRDAGAKPPNACNANSQKRKINAQIFFETRLGSAF